MKTTKKSTLAADGEGGSTRVPTDGLSRKERSDAEAFITSNSGDAGAFQNNPGVYDASVELPSNVDRSAMAWGVGASPYSPGGDDGSGGTTPSNNQEFGGQVREIYDSNFNPAGETEVVGSVPGAAADVSLGGNATVNTRIDIRTRSTYHSHPSGSEGKRSWIQGPSVPDMSNATNSRGQPMNNYVFARGENRVYVYSTNGVKATISTSGWLKRH